MRHFRFGNPVFSFAIMVVAIAFMQFSVFTIALAEEDELDMEFYPITTTDTSFQLSTKCPTKGMDLFFFVDFTEGGTIFDTCGIASANEGDWTLTVGGDGSITFWLYSPNFMTDESAANGWLLSKTEAVMEPGELYPVLIELDDDVLVVVIYNTEGSDALTILETELPCALSSSAVYVGDYPGDNSYDKSHRPYRAAIADVNVMYFGPVVDDFEDANLAKTWVIPYSGIHEISE